MPTAIVQRFSVKPFFRWYDLWVGAYWDRENKVLYICPIPMFGLKIKIPWRKEYHCGWCTAFGSPCVDHQERT